MKINSKIFVAGGASGLVGSAIVRKLKKHHYTNIIVKKRSELNLFSQKEVEAFFKKYRPEYVFLAAAKVGGIMANMTQKADFIYENCQIQNNVIYNAWKYKVRKLLFLGSSCVYPKDSKQPIKEKYFLTGKPEETNDAYAIAKIAGVKMCQSFNSQYKTNFISLMPTNAYGPNDSFDLKNCHVIPALIRRLYQAKIDKSNSVTLWGGGRIYREFLYVDDLADACVFLMDSYNDSEIINVGTGKDIMIRDLAEVVKKTVGYRGKICWDLTKPDGMKRKRLDVTKLFLLGWRPKTTLEEGIKKEYQWFLKTI